MSAREKAAAANKARRDKAAIDKAAKKQVGAKPKQEAEAAPNQALLRRDRAWAKTSGAVSSSDPCAASAFADGRANPGWTRAKIGSPAIIHIQMVRMGVNHASETTSSLSEIV